MSGRLRFPSRRLDGENGELGVPTRKMTEANAHLSPSWALDSRLDSVKTADNRDPGGARQKRLTTDALHEVTKEPQHPRIRALAFGARGN